MILMKLDNNKGRPKTTKNTPNHKKKKQSTLSVPVSANLQSIMQDSDSEDSSSDDGDEDVDVPCLLEDLSGSDDDDDSSQQHKKLESKARRVTRPKKNAYHRRQQTAAARLANNRSLSEKNKSQLSRARKKRRISAVNYRAPRKRRQTDAQRQVSIAVERMRKASDEYKKSATDLYNHIVTGTTHKLLDNQADDAHIDDFTPGQLSRVNQQAFAVAEIYEGLSELVELSARCLARHKSIYDFFQGDDGLSFEWRRNQIYERVSKKFGSKKKVFRSKTHRAYIWEAQYRQTGRFRRDLRGTAQVCV